MNGTRDAAHFAQLYDGNADPWGFQTEPYEQAKYRHCIAVLGGRLYTSGLEVGCSIGVLTHMLAPLCQSLLGVDIVEQPLDAARRRCADQPWVQFLRMQVPREWPERHFDLILLSEVLYFLSPTDIDRCASRVKSSLLPGARVLLVNWLGRSDDPCTGDEAADRFIAATANFLSIARRERQPRYRLDLLTGA